MGDKERARQEVETALTIDPDFLAARVLKDQLETPDTSTVPPAPEVFQPVPAAAPLPPSPATLAASAAKLASFEQKVKQRVQARESVVKSVRQPPADSPARQPASAAARVPWSHAGAVAAAGIAFAVAISSTPGTRGPQLLYSHATASAAPLVDAAMPLPVDFTAPAVEEPEPSIERVVLRQDVRAFPLRVTVATPILVVKL